MGTETVAVRVAGHEYRLRCLADRTQREDPMFGELWPSGIALAEDMAAFPIEGKRILEVGCGLALPSLVLKHRGADITASDHHPEAEDFLKFNAKENGLPPVPFRLASWKDADLGRFDLIIGADLLYERDQPALLAGFLSRHAPAEAIIADPGRRQLGEFNRLMAARGYAHAGKRAAGKVRLLRYSLAEGAEDERGA